MQLVADGVSVRFGGLVALDDVSLTLAKGEIVGLIGPNGAGKTTMVNVLSGFQRPHRGGVAIDGRVARRLSARDFARAGVVRTFQAVRLFKGLNVGENVEVSCVSVGMGRRTARTRAVEVLDYLRMGAKSRLLPAALNYGDERRVGLARALALNPRYLLLDEPAAGLNVGEADEFREQVGQIRTAFDCGILIIEHNMSVVMNLCERVHVLATGRSLASGRPKDVLADVQVRQAYLGSELLLMHEDAAARTDPMAAPTGAATDKAILTVEGLVVRYGAITALRGIDLTVGANEIIAIIGPNGAGKTTLLSAIAGIVRPAAGRIVFCDRPITGQIEDTVRRKIALVPEGRHVFAGLTVEENLKLGATIRPDRDNVAREIAAYMQAFPILAQRRNQPAGQLSGGEQQQLVIVRALLSQPRLLLLDEPSLGLAPRLIEDVYRLIVEIRARSTAILVVEQNATRALAVADRVFVLNGGVMRMGGRREEIAGHPDFEAAYFGLPTGAEAPVP